MPTLATEFRERGNTIFAVWMAGFFLLMMVEGATGTGWALAGALGWMCICAYLHQKIRCPKCRYPVFSRRTRSRFVTGVRWRASSCTNCGLSFEESES